MEKDDANELIYKTETLTDLREWTYVYQRRTGGGRDKLGVRDSHMPATTYEIDNQQGSTVEHKKLYSLFSNKLYGEIIWKRMAVCTCITEALCWN